jgi:DHA1 family inner membrane transport protein
VAGNVLAGRVPSASVLRLLPVPVGALALVLLVQGPSLRYRPLALATLVLLGCAAFMIVPLVQTWLMGRAGPQAAGLAASVNISVAGVAGALGAALGGAVLAAGFGPAWISVFAAVPVLAATVVALGLRSSPCSTVAPGLQ